MFYDLFCNLCVERKKSPTSVLRDLGISSTNLSNWRSGRVPYDSTRRKIAAYFGVPLSYFYGDTEPAPKKTDEDEALDRYLDQLRSDPDRRMLFELLDGATVEEVRAAVAIVDALKKASHGR